MEPENSSPQETMSCHEDKTLVTTRNKSKNHPRRFTDEQIKSLESIFELEPKLEPRKKLQTARDLGLQPRQVAVWFQNRRARWKSKQLEQEYRLLRCNYDTLSTRFEDLRRENFTLQMQLQELSELVKNLDNVGFGDRNVELKEYPNSSSEGMDQDDEKIAKYFDRTEDQELVSWAGEGEGEKDAEVGISGLLDRPYGNSEWWES